MIPKSNASDFEGLTCANNINRTLIKPARFDPVGGGRINVSLVRPLLHQLPRPLGFGKRIRSQPLSVYEEERFLTILTELQVCSTSSFPV